MPRRAGFMDLIDFKQKGDTIMKSKAGVEFSFCIKAGKTRQCCFCDNKQRDKCEAIATLDNRYCDDTRNIPNKGKPFSLGCGGDS